MTSHPTCTSSCIGSAVSERGERGERGLGMNGSVMIAAKIVLVIVINLQIYQQFHSVL